MEEEIRDAVLAELVPPVRLEATVQHGVVTLRGSLRNRALVPLTARAIRAVDGAVEGVVDVRMELDGAEGAAA
ncbi:BON domain-containing protein [Streptomyces sp. NPDC020858]|uniref:BON domain-containing protein n=1 Tax=Streptomyces sp. NPDC020858 TaxID=3365097 RepID=UPI0037AD11C5